MISVSRCRVTALLPLALLAGCGGVGRDIGEAFGEAVGEGLSCGILNCTESATLNVDEISPRITATQVDASRTVAIEASLGKSANLLTTVLIAPNERLTAGVDGGAEVAMDNPDGRRYGFSASLASSSAQPVVRVVFTRAGMRHVSEVTLPAAFSVLQPTGQPGMTRGGAALPVRLSLASSGDAGASASGTCSRTDGSSFAVKGAGLNAVAETGVAGGYRLEPAAVDTALNAASRSANNGNVGTPAVAQCQLTVAWTRSSRGSVAATMNGHGSITGLRQASHPLAYDARS
ncbi:MAG: hypothetical protein GXC94_08560 [Comamonadaceae bacterium]|nr:hypothetical protein [Comamonadaceae bacterium]